MVEVLASRLLLRPSDFESSMRFYEDVLGLTRSREFGAPPRRGVVYFLGGAELEITESPAQDAGLAAKEPDASMIRVWLRVADARAACEEVARRGAAIAEAPERKPWGLVEGRLHDPDGLEIVIVEVPRDHPMRVDTRSQQLSQPPGPRAR